MATDRQIAANRLNAARSTGPRSDEGKTRSRANATKHGLAGESNLVEAELADAFEQRRAAWGAEYRPSGEAAGWALDRAVVASLRIEQCERATEEVVAVGRQRASMAWDQDREVEAATIFGRLGRDPVLASRQLQATRAGAELMIEAWSGLVAGLDRGRDWSESEESQALDLLGVGRDLRSGRTLIDADAEAETWTVRRDLALEEIDRLERMVEAALGPLDAMDRRRAMVGHSALLSKPAKLILRYERDAWRRYRESIRQVKESSPASVEDHRPAVEARPEVREDSPAGRSRTIRPGLRAAIDRIDPMGLVEESEWFEASERRDEEEARRATARLATDRSQFTEAGRG